ncbi:MAG: hypothetical protein WDO56_27150 [Gammaproteobacteria bacterium]
MERQHKLSALALSVLAAAALGSAHANTFNGASSDTGYVTVGESDVTAGPHHSGLAGIAVQATGLNLQVDFQGLSSYGGTGPVYQLSYPYDPSVPHSNLGVFSFKRAAAGEDVWFGEWSTDGASNYSSRTVYYVGDKTNFSLPASTTSATYTIDGINKNAGSTSPTLSGSLYSSLGADRWLVLRQPRRWQLHHQSGLRRLADRGEQQRPVQQRQRRFDRLDGHHRPRAR